MAPVLPQARDFFLETPLHFDPDTKDRPVVASCAGPELTLYGVYEAPGQDHFPVLFLVGKILEKETGRTLAMCYPAPEIKHRLLGGVVYRKWESDLRASDGEEENNPAPRRAKPLRRKVNVWRQRTIPTGRSVRFLYQTIPA